MRVFRTPKLSGSHRIAAIALLRALLLQCRQQPTAGEALANVVRNRFKKNSIVESPRLLQGAFKAGYEALDILSRAADGDGKSQSQIKNLLSRIPTWLKAPVLPLTPKQSSQKSPTSPTIASQPHDPTLQEGENTIHNHLGDLTPTPITNPHHISPSTLAKTHPILLRPHQNPNLTNPRKIPVWTRAHGIPFLRTTKPQPPAITSMIRSRSTQREKWMTWREHFAGPAMELATREDEWDQFVGLEAHEEGLSLADVELGDLRMWRKRDHGWFFQSENSWRNEVREVVKELVERLRVQTWQNRALSEEMYMVVGRERVVAEKEKVERRRAKYLERQSAEDVLTDKTETDAEECPKEGLGMISTSPVNQHRSREPRISSEATDSIVP